MWGEVRKEDPLPGPSRRVGESHRRVRRRRLLPAAGADAGRRRPLLPQPAANEGSRGPSTVPSFSLHQANAPTVASFLSPAGLLPRKIYRGQTAARGTARSQRAALGARRRAARAGAHRAARAAQRPPRPRRTARAARSEPSVKQIAAAQMSLYPWTSMGEERERNYHSDVSITIKELCVQLPTI